MTAFEITLVISALGSMLVQVISALKTKAQVRETHDAVNSRMDKFLADQKVQTAEILQTAVAAAHAAGVKLATDLLMKQPPPNAT